jgi:hypothetical protein
LEVDYRGLQTLLEDRSSVRSVIGGLCFDITELDTSFGDFRVGCVGKLTWWPTIVQAWCRPLRLSFLARLHPRLVIGASSVILLTPIYD